MDVLRRGYRRSATAGLLVAALSFSLEAAARAQSKEECREASDFIRNAALSRENGMDGVSFLARTIADLEAIRSFPPSLRWFVKDQSDEDYLLSAVADVFSHPREPLAHQRQFLGDCVTRISTGD